MDGQLTMELTGHAALPSNEKSSLADDLIWEVAGIADEIGKTRGRRITCWKTVSFPPKKVGGRWVSSRSALRAHFAFTTEAA